MKNTLIYVLVILLLIGLFGTVAYLSMGKAGVERFKKNWQSKWQDGINREIVIYNANGEIIFTSKGRFDFTYDSECIEYIDADTGLKHNIFTGYNATVIINELKNKELKK